MEQIVLSTELEYSSNTSGNMDTGIVQHKGKDLYNSQPYMSFSFSKNLFYPIDSKANSLLYVYMKWICRKNFHR